MTGVIAAVITEPTIEIDHPFVLVKQRQPVYILIRFQIPEIKEDSAKPRPELNLGLVIDRSGSMSDRGKLDYAKKAANILIDSMKPIDRIAVVEYDDQITLLWPSSPVESPEMIKTRINSLSPRGSTNLTGGMMKGVEEVLKNPEENFINRVLLLSDGLANQGITNPFEIKRLVQESKGKGVHISTMGLGLHYDEDLMQAIAENGGGNYYYIENPDQMARIFQQEMSILFTTVAKEIDMKLIAGEDVKKVDVYGFSFNVKGNETEIEQEDFYSGENRTLLLRLEIEPLNEGMLNMGKLLIGYMDVEDKSRKKYEKDLAVTVTTDGTEVKGRENKNVMVEATLIEAEKRHEEYIRLYEKGEKTEAIEKIRKLEEELTEKNVTFSDVQIRKKIEALEMEAQEMNEAEMSSDAMSSYLKKSKQRFYQAQKGKRGKYMLQEGDKGYDVERLQEALKDNGYYQGPIDGVFSQEVAKAVNAFQKKENLTPDGIAGPLTLKALGIY